MKSLVVSFLTVLTAFCFIAEAKADVQLCGVMSKKIVSTDCPPEKMCAPADVTVYQIIVNYSAHKIETMDPAVFAIFDQQMGKKVCVTGHPDPDGAFDVVSVDLGGGSGGGGSSSPSCPDLTGVYGSVSNLGLAVVVNQTDCTKMTMAQYRNDGSSVIDQITFDGQFHVLNSMPQFETSFTFDATRLIGTSNDVKTHAKLRNFIFSLDVQGNMIEETVKFDGKGHQTSDSSGTLPRCPKNQDCTH